MQEVVEPGLLVSALELGLELEQHTLNASERFESAEVLALNVSLAARFSLLSNPTVFLCSYKMSLE